MYSFSLKILILYFFISSTSYASLLEVRINKMHGLVLFIESIAEVKQRAPAHKKIYIAAYAKNKKIEAYRKELISIHKKFYASKIYGYPKTTRFMSAIMIETTFAKTLAELKNKVMVDHNFSFNKKILQRYFELLDTFLPIYESLIWDKSYADMLETKTRIEKIIAKKDISGMIRTAAIFYLRNPNNLKTFHLNLHPVPKGKSTKAFRIENTASIGVVLGGKRKTQMNLKWLLSSTIFHEICHDLYGPNKQRIKKIFAKYSSATAKRVKNIINESLATSIGAGWVFHRLTGANAKNSWYNNKEYNLFAKALYKDVSDYLNHGKALDDQFVQLAITHYNVSVKK
ncbi:MAG: hypothetical protein QM479_11065 [Pseudomonadota bacterium]